MLSKGQSFPDGTYKYICGCGFKNPECAYCCGNNLKQAQESIKTARGKVYYGLLKTILSHIGKAMVDDFRSIGQKQGKVTPIDVGWLSLKYGINFKATCEYLEEVRRMPTGTYERIKLAKDYSVKFIYEEARKKYEPQAEAADQ